MITISHIFYTQHALLPLHLRAWAAHPADAARYTLIDDASPTAAPSWFRHPNLSIYRVAQDIPWNIAGTAGRGQFPHAGHGRSDTKVEEQAVACMGRQYLAPGTLLPEQFDFLPDSVFFRV